MVNSSSYHTLDSAQYFVDGKPKYDGSVVQMEWSEMLRRGNQKRKQIQATAAKVSKGGRVRPVSYWKPRKRVGR